MRPLRRLLPGLTRRRCCVPGCTVPPCWEVDGKALCMPHRTAMARAGLGLREWLSLHRMLYGSAR